MRSSRKVSADVASDSGLISKGQVYNYYRDYDPVLGRYVQSDPIGLSGGMNTYAYANNNSIKNFDSLGLSSSLNPVDFSVSNLGNPRGSEHDYYSMPGPEIPGGGKLSKAIGLLEKGLYATQEITQAYNQWRRGKYRYHDSQASMNDNVADKIRDAQLECEKNCIDQFTVCLKSQKDCRDECHKNDDDYYKYRDLADWHRSEIEEYK